MISFIIGFALIIVLGYLVMRLCGDAEPNWRAITALLIGMIIIAFFTGSLFDRALAL